MSAHVQSYQHQSEPEWGEQEVAAVETYVQGTMTAEREQTHFRFMLQVLPVQHVCVICMIVEAHSLRTICLYVEMDRNR